MSNIESSHDIDNRRTNFHGDIYDTDILGRRDRNLVSELVRNVRYQIADHVACKVMERLGPLIDGALTDDPHQRQIQSLAAALLSDSDGPTVITSDLRTPGSAMEFETMNPKTGRKHLIRVTISEQ